ncbi:MAG TPA: hypothetical protein VKA17_03740 [Gammaproteobacteria bacterium]|nr:hypothetical protein [Gammaproteobacteria bacterium]
MNRLPLYYLATLLVASIFAARAALRLAQPEFNVLHFAVLGWPAWTVWGSSAVELVGALLLLRRDTFAVGAVLLSLLCVAFAWAYASAGTPSAGLGSLGLLAALVGLLLRRRVDVARSR